jgi:hypothetical protein
MIDYLDRTAGPLTAAIAFAVLFASTDDFNPLHLARVASEDVGLRLCRWERFAGVSNGREAELAYTSCDDRIVVIRIDLAAGDRA